MATLTIDQIEALMRETFPPALDFAQILELGEDTILIRAPFKEGYLRPGGTVSGPTMMTVADSAAYFLVLAMNGPMTLAVTSSLDIHFLRKPTATALIGRAKMLSLSMRNAVVEVEITNEGSSALVAKSTVHYALPRRQTSARE